MTYRHPRSASMTGETSPVKAPAASQNMSCAPSPTADPSKILDTSARLVKGGHTATSTLAGSALRVIAETRARASATVVCIFQLPTTNGVRAMSPIQQGRDTGEVLTLKKLQGRSPAGRNVGHAVREPHLLDGRGGIAPADNSYSFRLRHRFGNRPGPRAEGREFKHAHRPIPHHCSRAGNHRSIRRGGLGSDVHPHPPRGDGFGGDDARSRVFCEAVGDNHIIGQPEADAAFRRV